MVRRKERKMNTVELLRCLSLPRTGKRTGRRILAGLFALGIVTLVACGTPASSPTAVAEACWEAVAAGDTEAALDRFIDNPLVTVDQTIFNGKDRIRDWIDKDLAFLAKGAECSEWSNVKEGANSLDFYERCTIENVPWEGHHTLIFENGKIRSWTMTFKRVE
jgi:hypothetical protein